MAQSSGLFEVGLPITMLELRPCSRLTARRAMLRLGRRSWHSISPMLVPARPNQHRPGGSLSPRYVDVHGGTITSGERATLDWKPQKPPRRQSVTAQLQTGDPPRES